MSGKSILLDRISFLLPQLLYYEVHLVSSGPVRVCVSQKKDARQQKLWWADSIIKSVGE